MASAAIVRRRTAAQTAGAAGKQRRRTILAVALAVVLVSLLAYQAHAMKLFGNSSTPTAAVVSAPSSPAPAQRHVAKADDAAGTGADPFAARWLPHGDAAAAGYGGPD